MSNTAEVLIAEDSEETRYYLKRILKPLNLGITEVENGDLALEKIKEREFDVVLMDIVMPGKSGLEVTKKVREELGYLFTPIIVMTAYNDEELIETAFKSGASDFMIKPLSKNEVLSRISKRIQQRNLEREMCNARAIAEKSNREKSDFITRLAHELKTPLNAIIGYTQLTKIKSDDQEIKTNCYEVLNAAKHQESLIREVTDLTKIEAGIIDICITDIDLFQAIENSIHLVQPMADEFNITLNKPLQTKLGYLVKADYTRLIQVLVNLMSNAIKYNKADGKVNILIKNDSDQRIKIGISDSGIGIAEKDIPLIFEAFNRLGASNTDIEGLGLGLPITKKIVELMGGVLEVESVENEGSIFWLELTGCALTHHP